MNIRRIHLRKDDLLKIAETERAFVLLAGHMLNELNSLQKVFTWCLHAPSPSHTPTIESLANSAQAMLYARILAGKLWEAWKGLEKAFFGNPFSKEVVPKLDPVAQNALKEIKSYFAKPNSIINKVRNSFAFHYSIEEFKTHWDEAANEQNFELILGGTIGNTIHLAAEIVVNTALLNGINSGDKAEALRTFLDDVQSTASNLTDFLEGAILAILEEQLGSSHFETLWREEEIFPSLSHNEVAIPFFIKPE